jgi:hypothetical protein
VARLSGGDLPMEDLHLLFLPNEVELLLQLAERVERMKGTVLAAPLGTWPAFFDTLLRFKEKAKIYNSATAVLEMVRIVNEELDRQEQE